MSKSWPVVVIVESRTIPEAADVMYRTAQEEFTRYEITCSRISVAHMLDIPAAIRFAAQGVQNKSQWREPMGFIAAGSDVKSDMALIHYQQTLAGIQHLALHYHYAIASALHLQSDDALTESQTFQDYHQRIFEAVQSLIGLADLRHKLKLENQ